MEWSLDKVMSSKNVKGSIRLHALKYVPGNPKRYSMKNVVMIVPRGDLKQTSNLNYDQ